MEWEASHQNTVSWGFTEPRKKKKKSSHTQRTSFASVPGFSNYHPPQRPYWGREEANGSLREAQARETRMGVCHADARLGISFPESKEAILARGPIV